MGRTRTVGESPLNVRILRLAGGGDGVGRLDDGRTVFVPRTAPGDLVELTAVRSYRRYARARPAKIVEAGPDRITPPCPHYRHDDCGGCQLQHINDGAQLAARASFVGDALRRIGHLDVSDPPIEPAAETLGYRTRLTLARSGDGRRIGLHRYDRPDEVFELEWCHITDAALNQLWTAVRRHRELLPENLTQLVLRLDRSGGRHLVIRVSGGEIWQGGPALHRALSNDGDVATIWLQPEGGAARAVAGAGEAFPATAFEQVHPAMGDRVRQYALEQLGAAADRAVWDLYAGTGQTTELLRAAGARVESVEVDRRAVEHAERGLPSHPPELVRRAARVEDVADRLRPPDLVITNPPRTGMDQRVTDALARRQPERIVYISCDPATLARDLSRIISQYRLVSVHAFDLFPQTAHVETVAVLERS